MKRHQIVEATENANHAGKKAPADVAIIAEKLGYQPHVILMNNTDQGIVAKVKRQMGYWKSWKECYRDIDENAVVLIQNPFHNPQLTRNSILKKLRKDKHVHFFSLIHDVEELRNMTYDSYYKKEFEFMVEISDVFIVHNEVMKRFFVEKGIPENQIVVLDIFDYLHSYKDKKVIFSKSVAIAGNLDTNKCQYIGMLHQLSDVQFKLYGVNFNEKMRQYPNISYMGSFPVDEIPSKLDSGFGLVWDGESIQDCQGASGQYLKYNNPHKLSLYLSSGLPVIIWSQAAEAKFVKRHNVGICIDSLEDLPAELSKIDEKKYQDLTKHVRAVAEKLMSGNYTAEAICKVEKIMQMK